MAKNRSSGSMRSGMRAAPGCFPSAITASGSRPNTCSRSSGSSNGSTGPRLKAPGSDSLFARRSWSARGDASGRNRSLAGDLRSSLHFTGWKSGIMSSLITILLAEDNPGDVFLVRRALEKNGLRDVELVVVEEGQAALRYIERVDSDDSVFSPDLALLDL